MSPLPPTVSFQTPGPIDIGVGTFIASFVVYLVFHRYEPDSPAAIISSFLLVPGGLGLLARQCTGSTLALAITTIAYYFLLALFTVLYRLSPFHPLAKFPGPVLHKISKLRSAHVAQKGHLHVYYQQLHRRYGDIVRVGPNELSYVNVDGVRGTLSNGMPKGPFYNRNGDVVSMLNSRDAVTHARLRKPWARAFATTSLMGYENMVVRRARELIESLDKRHSENIDISEWMEFFSFDLMGDLVFSFSFDMMKDGHDLKGYWKMLTGTVRRFGVVSQIPWAFKYVTSPSNPFRSPLDTEHIAKMMVGHRMKAGSMTRDIFYHLSYEDEKKTQEISMKQLVVEGVVAIIAGSDTTSTVLANLWYYLMRNPVYFARLREEVDTAFPSGEEPLDQEILSEMRYLNACINESLRLQPPVPNGSQRMVTPGTGGKMVGPHFIPEGNHVRVLTYSLHRDPRYFSPYPDSFWPDRWLAPEDRRDIHDMYKPLGNSVQVTLETKAFAPFSSGPAVCVGKTLAIQEMRIVASWIVQRFDVQPAKGYDLDEWEKNLTDYYVMQKGGLPVVLSRRG